MDGRHTFDLGPSVIGRIYDGKGRPDLAKLTLVTITGAVVTIEESFFIRELRNQILKHFPFTDKELEEYVLPVVRERFK